MPRLPPLGFRDKVLQKYIDGTGSVHFLADNYVIGYPVLRGCINIYRIHGISAFCYKKNSTYSKESKIKYLEAVINGEGSVDDIIARYEISSCSVLKQQIKIYNTNREPKDYNLEQEVCMAEARRKTIFEEHKEIVGYCISNNCDYKNMTAKQGVS